MDNYYIKAVRMDGIETTYEMFFSVVKEDTQEEFVFYIEMEAEDPGVLVYKRDIDGSLINIESQEDWEYASQTFDEHLAKVQAMDCETFQLN